MADPNYRRVLLKVSGEALAGENATGIEAEFLNRIARQVVDLARTGIEIAVVIGGGNIFRGLSIAASGGDRVVGDQMGMLATVINALALGDAIRRFGGRPHVFSNVSMPTIAETFTQRAGIAALEGGAIVLCAGGTGSPFFTTDTAAALKAVELKCDVLLKGTKVDGVYDSDPKTNRDARRFDTIGYDEVIARNLRVMDTAAFALARDNSLPIIVYALDTEQGLGGVLGGTAPCTRVG